MEITSHVKLRCRRRQCPGSLSLCPRFAAAGLLQRAYMAEAGPSSPSVVYSSTSSPTHSRHSRIHFPADDPGGLGGDDQSRLRIGLGQPPVVRRSIAGQGKAPAAHVREDGRRRVRSVDDPSSRAQARYHRVGENGGPSSRRVSSATKGSRRERGLSGGFLEEVSEFEWD